MSSIDYFRGAEIISIVGLYQDSEEVVFTTNRGLFSIAGVEYRSGNNITTAIEDFYITGAIEGSVVVDFIKKSNSTDDTTSCDVVYTFFTVITNHGYLDLRFYCPINTYYSEDAMLCHINYANKIEGITDGTTIK